MKYNKNDYSEIIKEVDQSIRAFQGLPLESKKEKNAEIISKINYFINLTDKIEDRRSKIQNFSYQYLGIMLTALGILIKFKTDIPNVEFLPVFLCVSVQIITAIIMIVWYEFQSSFRYPFLYIDDYSNNWKWFYYGNKHIIEINPNPVFDFEIKKVFKSYFCGLKLLIDNYSKEDLNSELRNNVIQLYLLQVHNYYKNKFYLQLTNIRKFGFYIFICIAIVYLLVKLYVYFS